jgi:hypothetical protein
MVQSSTKIDNPGTIPMDRQSNRLGSTPDVTIGGRKTKSWATRTARRESGRVGQLIGVKERRCVPQVACQQLHRWRDTCQQTKRRTDNTCPLPGRSPGIPRRRWDKSRLKAGKRGSGNQSEHSGATTPPPELLPFSLPQD